MSLSPYKSIILDFDGVLVESNAIKAQAFEALFSGFSEHMDAILDYHRRHAVIRFKKFKYIYENILKRPYTPQDEEALGLAFSKFCVEAVIKCPEVKGATEFLNDFSRRVPLYLVSINPADDLAKILEARKMTDFFKKVYTPEGSKADAIRDILSRERLRPNDVVFIGDSMGDYGSAQEADIDFIGRLGDGSEEFPGARVFKDMQQIGLYLNDKVEVLHA